MEPLLTCSVCNREYRYNRATGHRRTICNSCIEKRKHQAVKQKAVAYLGGKCLVCGYDRCYQAMVFHHLDPELKDFGISGNANRSWDKIQVELDKCVLLCANCHSEVHAGIVSSDELARRVSLVKTPPLQDGNAGFDPQGAH